MESKPSLAATLLRVVREHDALFVKSRRLIRALRDILFKCETAGEMQHVARKALYEDEVKNDSKV